MRCDYLIKAIGCIDSSLVDEAENYRPKRKNHAWIWAAASAACLLIIVGAAVLRSTGHFLIGDDTNTVLYYVVHAGGKAERYTDYAAVAEKGTVTITDELMTLLDENKEPTVKTPDGHKAEVFFGVHVYDAGGASAEDVFKTCLSPLGIRYEEHEGFSESGIISLTREQMLSVKCPPQLALVIEPWLVEINDKYLDTIDTDTLKVRVILSVDLEDLLEGIEVGDKLAVIEEYTSALSDEYTRDYGINGISAEYSGAYNVSFIGEFDVELIAQMLTDPRTERVCIDNSEKYK